MTSSRTKMPSKLELAKYWQQQMPTHLNDGQITTSNCWACGDTLRLERAHIVPKAFGGQDTVDNLHILCARCHLESETFTGNEYWRWYEYMFTHCYDMGLPRLKRRAYTFGYMEPNGNLTDIGQAFVTGYLQASKTR